MYRLHTITFSELIVVQVALLFWLHSPYGLHGKYVYDRLHSVHIYI